MTIYILDEEIKKCAQYIDDRSLGIMIEYISKVLCNVHHSINRFRVDFMGMDKFSHKIPPLDECNNFSIIKWKNWASECRHNYLWLIELGLELINEWSWRYHDPKCEVRFHKFHPVIKWAKGNIPDLPKLYEDFELEKYKSPRVMEIMSEIPIIVPKKYLTRYGLINPESNDLILSYRNYYKSKFNKKCIKHDACIYSLSYCCLKLKPAWTRRQSPEWLYI